MRIFLVLAALTLIACGGNGGASDNSPLPAGPMLTAIHDVQGAGETSPLNGQDVTVEGVVTGDFQEGDADTARTLGGFFLQNDPDSDPATSDGVFVFDGSNPVTDVGVGDLVRVSGTVNEYFGETQISASTVTVIGAGEVQPVPVDLPSTATTTNSNGELIADLERYEGMLVSFPQTLTVSQLRNLERFGEVLLSAGGREYSYTNLNAPDVPGYAAHRNAVAARRIHLDDGLRRNNSGSPLEIRNGDEITDLTGVLRFSRGSGSSGTEAYRLMPTLEPQFDNINLRPAMPELDGSLHVAMFNLNNYFSTVDNGARICGPAGDARCRGADSDEELSRQLARIVTVLAMLDADVVAMIELENNASASLQMIVDSVNNAVGDGTYDFVDTGTFGDDAIKVGLIFKPASVRTVGDFAILDSSVDVRFDDSRHRPVLAQTFATRSLAAAAMLDWIATDPTSSGDSDFLVIGDFNTHTMGAAMEKFEIAGFVNLASRFIGESAYSFEFDGQFGALDHAVASPSLADRVVDAAEWHINADEARFYDYNLEFGRDPALFDPYRLLISIKC